MAKSISFNKRENEKKKLEKRLEKQKRKEDRKSNNKGGSFEDQIAYVDENGVITDTPPDLQKKEEIDLESISISTPKKGKEAVDYYTGRVEHFNESKGYGFVKDLSGQNKYFFHISSAPEGIAEGDTVFFDLERGAKGMNAVNLRFEEPEEEPLP